MAKVASANPDDIEASIFYALAIAAAAPPTDKTYVELLKAGAILETIIASHPDHPGLSHYIIHSYDVPPLADRALAAARRYAKIAPSAPHALHMPSHTFTRVGSWQESIDTNIASGEAARREGATAEELHAMDYRTYAYLQTAQDTAARALLDALPAVKARFDPEAIGSAAPGSAGVFALAAIPARYALERGAWADAAALVPQPSKFLHADALTYFANALGAARTAKRGRRACGHRRAGLDQGPAHGTRRDLLGRTGRDSASRGVGVAGAGRRAAGGGACGDARRRGDGRSHREGGRDAGAADAGARAGWRDAAGDEPAG